MDLAKDGIRKGAVLFCGLPEPCEKIKTLTTVAVRVLNSKGESGMSSPVTSILLLSSAILFSGFATAGDPTAGTVSGGATLRVNGEPVKQSSIELLKNKQRIVGVLDNDELDAKVRDELIMETLFSRQALKNKLDTRPDIAAELDIMRLAILSRAYLNEYFKAHPVTEESIGAEYERRRAAAEIVEYRVRHLSVAKEEDARQLLKQIKAGKDFAELAKTRSTDPGANLNGGDIGWFRPDIFVDVDFANAVTRLKKGEMTREPVKTRWGWQIIKVEDGPRPVKDVPPFNKVSPEVKDAMMQKAMKQKLDELIASTRATAKITHSVAAE